MTGLIVHEWLSPAGGSENVFEAIAGQFPDAERWCLWNDAGDRLMPVNETWIARSPLRGRKALALPLMPSTWRHLPKRDADWILTSTHLFSHHARFRGAARDVPKLVYTHTPARYIWVPELDGRGNSLPARALSAALKPLDRTRAQEATAIAANSEFIKRRIANTWNRDSEVIYPPVEVEKFLDTPHLSQADEAVLSSLPDDFVLGFSRFVPYKRLEAAIATGKAADLPVVLAGSGPDEERLRDIAERDLSGRVTFVHHPSDALLAAIMQRASLLVFAPIEDFGIIPVESMAAGTPVLANAIGGAVESVIDGVTGAHVRDWESPAELRSAAERALACSADDCRTQALTFSGAVFARKIQQFVADHV